jgi:hypothetical protein
MRLLTKKNDTNNNKKENKLLYYMDESPLRLHCTKLIVFRFFTILIKRVIKK